MLKVIQKDQERDTRGFMADARFYDGYSRWNETENRYETWEEAISRVMDMHRTKYKDKMSDELSQLIDEAEALYKLKYCLGAQRSLQFGGDQILRKNMKLYNCSSSYADRPAFFQEIFWILLCGAGAGFSVQKHHVEKLPNVQERKKQAKGYVIPDSIEGWADALGVLLSSYFEGGGTKPEFEGRKVYFDLSKIRPKGSMISGGFKAPGPEPLRRALDRIEYMLQGVVLSGRNRLKPIEVYDIVMHASDAVLAGGVRRSATICLFSPDDEEMINAKTGNWFEKNPQRARSNNSAVIVRNEVERETFTNLMSKIKEFGEPGFFFVSNKEHATNPCCEIGMYPSYEGESGWQVCNLTEINGGMCVTEAEFFKACRAAAILGTLQAGYTDFDYLEEVSKKIIEREALLGVSITGWMNNPDILFDAEIQRKGAELIKKTNKEVAALIGINPAARTTTVKPSGNASVLLKTASGIHPEHAPRYIRNIQLPKDSEVSQLIAETNPYMIEDSVWSSAKTDYVISFPIIAPEGSIYKDEMYGTNLLEKVKLVQQNWIEAGTNVDRCVDPTLRHNVSNTVTVKDNQWDKVEKYVFENRNAFAGISFLSASGDMDYNQAPMTTVLTEVEIIEKYGRAALFASGLIVDSHKGFNDLWEAIALSGSKEEQPGEISDIRADWIRRFRKFADSYFKGDQRKASYCLKDVHLLHKWTKIQQNLRYVDFVKELESRKFIDVDTLGSQACVGGVCDIDF